MIALALATILIAPSDPSCGEALAAAPGYPVCAERNGAVALSANEEEADDLVGYAIRAEPRFERHFTNISKPYAVLYFDESAPVAELRAVGFETVLAWASPQKIGRLFRQTLLQSAQGPDGAPLSSDAVAAVDAQAELLTQGIFKQQDGVIAHEVAHLWYRDAYWSQSDQPRDGYGTPAPDWLDEAAAILSESETMTEKRRKSFLDAWNGLSSVDRQKDQGIGDLDHLLDRSHPSLSVSSDAVDEPVGAQPVVTVRARTGDRDLYYSQVLSFADFLIETSGDARVLATITESMARGYSFEDWLAHQARYTRLAADRTELRRQWAEWVDRAASQQLPDVVDNGR